MYEHLSPSLCWTVSNKPSDTQSNCSQRVQPQALLPHTCTLADTSACIKESTGFFFSIYTGHVATIHLQYYPPVSLSSPPSSSRSPLSSAVSISLFHSSSSSVCPTSPPTTLLISVSFQYLEWSLAMPQPSSSISDSQILVSKPPFF